MIFRVDLGYLFWIIYLYIFWKIRIFLQCISVLHWLQLVWLNVTFSTFMLINISWITSKRGWKNIISHKTWGPLLFCCRDAYYIFHQPLKELKPLMINQKASNNKRFPPHSIKNWMFPSWKSIIMPDHFFATECLQHYNIHERMVC